MGEEGQMDGHQIRVLRKKVEQEIRGILRDEYGLVVEGNMPVRYYLDFKTHQRLLDLREVLERMDRGTFGNCIVCGGSIPDSRLADNPAARLCATCLPGTYPSVAAPPLPRHQEGR